MAKFTTHLAVGTVVSGTLATLTLAADVIAPQNLVAVTLAGCLGSVLPDIDLKDSRPSRALFAGLSIFLSFAVLFHFAERLSIVEMWVIWLGTLFFVRYGLHTLFHRFCIHRGIWHSLAAALVCSFATAIAFYYVFGRPDGVAWLAGAFMLVGYLTHLTLDEIYSVDIVGNYIKKSFGTALKPIDWKHPAASAGMVIAGLLLIFLLPPISTFAEGISSRPLWAGLHERLLPHDQKWFGVFIERGRLAAAPPETSLQTTGSLPAQPAPAAATPSPAPGSTGQ
jgi:hypothetical protein